MPCRVYFPPWADMFCPVHCTTLMRCLSQESLLLSPCQGIVQRLTRVYTGRTAMNKHDVLALLRDRPEDIDTDDLLYRLYLWQKLEAAGGQTSPTQIYSVPETLIRAVNCASSPQAARNSLCGIVIGACAQAGSWTITDCSAMPATTKACRHSVCQ